MARTIGIDIFSDPACPWCLLGIKRLDNAIDALPSDVCVDISYHPFLLDPNAKASGEDIVEVLTTKMGRPPFESWDRLEQEARASGLNLDMRKQKYRYATQAAQALIAAAQELNCQHELARAISYAYYLEARNIADPDVLVELGTEYGFEPDTARRIVTDSQWAKQIEAAAQTATQQGIQGVPFFIFNEKYALSGAQSEEVFGKAFEAVLLEAA